MSDLPLNVRKIGKEKCPIILAGPTASGKTALAVALAQQHDAIVINADSIQVYRDLEHLSARPSLDEMQGVPHFLFGHIDGAEPYSVGRWLQEVAALRAQYPMRKMIFCGGTGMYLKALREGFTDTPEIPQTIRTQVLGDYQRMGHDAFVAYLCVREPKALAHFEQAPDYQRVLRAAEVVYATKKPLVYWHREHQTQAMYPDAHQIALLPERTELYGRIDRRCRQMLPDALDEVAALCARNLPQTQSIMRCIGVSILAQVLAGELDQETALQEFARDTRRYAKRQITWLKHQMHPDQIIMDFGDAQDVLCSVLSE